VHGSLLVTNKYVAYARLGVKRIVQRQHGPAGVAENGVDTKIDQGVEQGLGAIAAGCFSRSIHVALGYCIR